MKHCVPHHSVKLWLGLTEKLNTIFKCIFGQILEAINIAKIPMVMYAGFRKCVDKPCVRLVLPFNNRMVLVLYLSLS